MRIAILGAGPAGMSAGYELAKNSDHTVEVFEAKDVVGGMAGSFVYNGQIVDYGPHRFFSKIDRANLLRDEIL